MQSYPTLRVMDWILEGTRRPINAIPMKIIIFFTPFIGPIIPLSPALL